MRRILFTTILSLCVVSVAWSQSPTLQRDLSGTHICLWGNDSFVLMIKNVDFAQGIRLYQGYMQCNATEPRIFGLKNFVEVSHKDNDSDYSEGTLLDAIVVTRYVYDQDGNAQKQMGYLTKMDPIGSGPGTNPDARTYGTFNGSVNGFGVQAGVPIKLSVARYGQRADDSINAALSGKRVAPPQ